MSHVTTFSELAIAVTLTRGLGQSALSVVSIAMVGHWFVRRIDMAMAIYSVALSIGFMIAFPVVGSIVQSRGWRVAWFAVGAAILVGLVPLAALLVRRNPESIGISRRTARRPAERPPRVPSSEFQVPVRTWNPEPELEPEPWNPPAIPSVRLFAHPRSGSLRSVLRCTALSHRASDCSTNRSWLSARASDQACTTRH